MKLYIPTSSLNAENILTCESIVPESECVKRTFGYSSFEQLEELQQFKNCTLAFTKIPRFEIHDPNRENHPMVVEIDVLECKKIGLEPIGDGAEMYVTANPIPVSPTSTRLLFFKKTDLIYTRNNCSASAKCKLFDYFESRFEIVPESKFGAPLTSYIKDLKLPKLFPSYSESDYDKAKGFIWGFGIGVLCSVSPDTAKLIKIQKRIYDIISSTKTENVISNAFQSQLDQLDSQYTQNDPIQQSAKSKWKERANQITSIEFYKFA